MHWLSPLRLGVLSLFLFLTACGGGGGDSAPAVVQPQPDPASWLQGSAVNSALVGAEIKLFRFDTDGTEVEIVAGSAPVLTDADGDYKFWITGGSINASTGPLILRSVGGTMNSAAAPTLEAVLADSSGLQADGATLTQHLSVGSSVAAALLRLQATQAAAAPSTADAAGIISLVEQQLAIGLDQDPSDPTQPLAIYAQSVDENLGLSQTPDNAPAVNEFIDYLALNLNSDSGQLDNTMQDPATGLMVPASFNNIGTGLLASLVSQGPASFQTVKISLDKREIENDGMDTAFLTASLVDGTGAPVADGTVVMYENTAGRVVVSRNRSSTVDGSSRINITSVWPGAAQVTVLYEGADQALHSAVVEMNIVNNVADVVDTIPPKVSSAGATSNTEILVSFSEAMRGGMEGAENPTHYRVSAVNSLLTPKTGAAKVTSGEKTGAGDQNNNKPEVRIIGAELILPDRKTVRLTTLSQSDLLYAVRVVNLADVNGNGMSAGEQFDSDPTRAEFEGVPPSGAEVVDTDGDGLSDSDEQRGWIVTTVTAAGVVLTFEVTSDPLNPDTDGDGVTDNEEFHGALNPRTADSDGDTLTDDQEWNTIFSDGLNQDTDGDGIQDGFEYNFFHTSPILADTDGDQISDPDEVAAGNRNPLVADLPSPRIRIGNVNLQLDTRFTFTDEEGKSVVEDKTFESTVTRGDNETFSTSNENSTKSTLEASEEIQTKAEVGGNLFKAGYSIQGTVGSKQGSEQGNTFTSGEESSRSSEEVYHESLSTSTARDVRESVTREVVDATVKVSVSIDNIGDIPFTISNLELSAQTQDPLDRRRMIPVAALVPENGGLGSVNIGALGDPSRGPFVFNTVSVFPQQVQELMKNPRGLVVQLANFDITDNEGNNFAFTSQEVLDRTAGITFDLGDGRVESYRVATASAHDPSTGRPLGISMEYMLSVIGLQRYATIRDGGNGVVETMAAGDDDAQDFAPGSQIEPGQIIVLAGLDGVINSAPQGDDVLVRPDYETTVQRDFDSIRDGINGVVDTTAVGDDVQLLPVGSSVSPGQLVITVGANGVLDTPLAGGDDVIAAASEPEHTVLTRFRDVESNVASKNFWVLFLSKARPGVDLDDYVVRAGEQFDFAFVQDKDDDGVWAREEYLHGSSDLLVNTDGCGMPNSPTVCDSLTDKEEIQEGWLVQLRSSPEGIRVYPNPNQGDSDRDRLLDDEERDCLLDPRQRDTDLDGLTDWEEINGKKLVEGVVTDMVSRDYQTNEITYAITPYAGMDIAGSGVILHDVIDGCSPNGFATDPLSADTDGDLVDDALELMLGLNPNDSEDGPSFLDDDGDGLPNNIEMLGWTRIVNGVAVTFTSNPDVVDTDGDLLPDLLEFYIGSNPRSSDTDGDGITDTNEYRSGGEACVTQTAGVACVAMSARPSFTFLEFLNKCDNAAVCNNADIDQSLLNAAARQLGTNVSERDSDRDTLTDPFELASRDILVNGGIIQVSSDPLDANSDADLWTDGVEFSRGTNPREEDTDQDGTNDDAEDAFGRDPRVRDKRVTITVASITATDVDDEGTTNSIEPRWHADVDPGTGAYVRVSNASGDAIDENDTITASPARLYSGVIRDDGTIVRVRITGEEIDPAGNANETLAPDSRSFDYTTTSGEVRMAQDFDGDGAGDGTLTTVLTILVQ